MFLTPEQIAQRPDIVESTERATLRMVAHAIFLYRNAAREIFVRERDLPSDTAEDITREKFRVRVSLPRLKSKARWRVQEVPVAASEFTWEQ